MKYTLATITSDFTTTSIKSTNYNSNPVEIPGTSSITDLPITPSLRRTPITKENKILFGKPLVLKSGKVNDLYRAILNIYERNENDSIVYPIIAMSLRLITEVAARVYFMENEPDKANKDQLYNEFLKIAKVNMRKENNNYLSLTEEWLDGRNNLEGMLGKYAHGNITVSQDGILKTSFILAEILEQFFKKK
jgi:hypothetical protein